MVIWLVPQLTTVMINIYFITIINIVITLTLKYIRQGISVKHCNGVSRRVLLQQGNFKTSVKQKPLPVKLMCPSHLLKKDVDYWSDSLEVHYYHLIRKHEMRTWNYIGVTSKYLKTFQCYLTEVLLFHNHE